MYNFPIGVLLESFRTDVNTSMKMAKELGISAVQVHAAGGTFDVDTVTKDQISEFTKMLNDNGLEVSALCGDFICGNPNFNFYEDGKKQIVIEKSKRILDLAKQLSTDIVTTHIGVVPADCNCDKYKAMQETCGELARYADKNNAHFAVETGPETAIRLKGFLDGLHSKGVGVNLDPANFVMVTGDDPVQAVYTLKDYIVHTHAKDGRRLIVGNPEIIYGEIETEIKNATYFIELPLGEGDVDFRNYMKALDDIGYKGYLTIEREIGENPKADISKAVAFLNNIKIQG
ncbi:sugar phosphate isomerase/epimerase family protein [Paludicola sp. MB14-C6]|uniref:sugar phosphate isomerase/epimerase family protein n=1 Tax=Paludihabitans sp. MB14-C6 TaxID=3070656 RepID=UPI0027DCB789|nr:sugar phosphate isomerase/epimerase family protein [Paludicola sp. MB14-C6]WMJ22972.1 sugar phosphate isomerase/epimerase family protein [Paludicola sp. MB14-C6]